MASSRSGGDSPAREQLSALRSLLVLAMLLTQQDSQGRCWRRGCMTSSCWPGRALPGISSGSTWSQSCTAATAGSGWAGGARRWRPLAGLGDVASIPVVVDVMAILTLMVLRRGQVVARRAGAAPAVSLRTWVEEVLGN
jgi:hypothetical protein